MRGQRLGTVLLAGLLVLSSLAIPIAGSIGSADAATIDNSDPAAISPIDSGPGLLVLPWWGNTTDNFNREEAEYSNKVSAYESAQSLKADIETQSDILENAYYDAQDEAWKDAEEAFLEGYIDGANQSEARQAGLDAMRDHFALRQSNFIEAHNNILLDVWSIQNQAESFSMPLEQDQYLTYAMHTHQDYPAMEFKGADFSYSGSSNDVSYTNEFNMTRMTFDIVTDQHPGQRSVTLADRTTKPATVFELEYKPWGYDSDNSIWADSGIVTSSGGDYMSFDMSSETYNFLDGNMHVSVADGSSSGTYDQQASVDLDHLRANLYPDNYPQEASKTSELVNTDHFSEIWEDYSATITEDTDAFATWADKSYQELEAGTVDPEDILNKFSLMEQQSDIDHTNATFSEVVAALAADGLSTPAGSTAYMNVSYQTGFGTPMNSTEGMLFSQTTPPNESWQVGTTYNSSTLGGAQIVVGLDGNMETIGGDFRIERAYDRDGTEIDNATISSPERTYQTGNLTELRQEIVDLSNQVAELRNQSMPDAGGGGGVTWPSIGIPNPLGFLGAFGQWLIVFIAAFGALLLLTVVS